MFELAGLVESPMHRPAPRERILVIIELSGGNDGLNTVIPYGDDAYYKATVRTLGIKQGQAAQARRSFRLQQDDDRLRAALQGRQ